MAGLAGNPRRYTDFNGGYSNGLYWLLQFGDDDQFVWEFYRTCMDACCRCMDVASGLRKEFRRRCGLIKAQLTKKRGQVLTNHLERLRGFHGRFTSAGFPWLVGSQLSLTSAHCTGNLFWTKADGSVAEERLTTGDFRQGVKVKGTSPREETAFAGET